MPGLPIDPQNMEEPVKQTSEGANTDLASQAAKGTPPPFRIEDRRVSARASGELADAAGEARSPYPSFVEELLAQTKQAEKKLAEKIQWMDDEISRTRERLGREQERKLEAEKKRIVQSFLEIGDHLERAIAAAESPSSDSSRLIEGVRLIQSIFLSRLQGLGAVPIQPKGRAFDPNFCEAVAMETVEQPELDHTVLEVLETGYIMGDHVLRPAKVKVGSLPQA